MADVLLRLSDIEKAGLARAAELRGLSLSGWARMTLREAATELLREHKLPVPFLPEAEMPKKGQPVPKTAKERPLKPNEIRIKPGEESQNVLWPNRESYLNSLCGGRRFPDDYPDLGGMRCYAEVLDDDDVATEDPEAYRTYERTQMAVYDLGFRDMAGMTAHGYPAEYLDYRKNLDAP